MENLYWVNFTEEEGSKDYYDDSALVKAVNFIDAHNKAKLNFPDKEIETIRLSKSKFIP